MKKIIKISLVFFVLFSCNRNKLEVKEGDFKDYELTLNGPVGVIPLKETNGKIFYKIIKHQKGYIVDKFNPQKNTQQTDSIFLERDIISKKTSYDEWGKNIETCYYELLSEDSLKYNCIKGGKNNLLPAHYQIWVIEDQLFSKLINYDSYDNITNVKGIAIVKNKFYSNELKPLINSESYFDKNDEPTPSINDYHKIIYHRNSSIGNLDSIKYYSEDGKPCNNDYDYHKIVYERNSNGFKTSESFFGLDNKPAVDDNEVHYYNYYVSNGNVLKEFRYDVNKKPIRSKEDGSHVIRKKYDQNGNLLEEKFFDPNDQPVRNKQGYHIAQYEYNELNQLKFEIYIDKENNLLKNNVGVYKTFYLRDSLNNVLIEAFYNKNGKKMKNDVDHVYMLKYKYDSLDREISKSYWSSENKKMNRWDGYHERRLKYDKNGFMYETTIHDFKGKLKKISLGTYAYSCEKNKVPIYGQDKSTYTYNNKGQCIELKRFKNGRPYAEPVEHNLKRKDNGSYNFCGAFYDNIKQSCIRVYHKIEYTYNDFENISTIRYFDNKGNKTNARIGCIDGSTSAHLIKFIYSKNSLVQQEFFKKNGEIPIKVIDCFKDKYVTSWGVNTKSSSFNN